MLSVIIITKNAEKDIRKCLESIAWANEIIILDSGSTDETLTIAKKFTDKIYETDWPGFGPQKNRALAKASCDWVLSIDADEWLSPDLEQEIKFKLSNPDAEAYEIKRSSIFLNKIIKFGSWRNDIVTRLFKKDCGQFTQNLVHERVIINGKTKRLKSHLYHHPYKNLDEVLNKINLYSTYSAHEKQAKAQNGNLIKALIHGLWMFIRCYVLKFGFLDGKQGFILAIANAESSYYRYLKLDKKLQQN